MQSRLYSADMEQHVKPWSWGPEGIPSGPVFWIALHRLWSDCARSLRSELPCLGSAPVTRHGPPG